MDKIETLSIQHLVGYTVDIFCFHVVAIFSYINKLNTSQIKPTYHTLISHEVVFT